MKQNSSKYLWGAAVFFLIAAALVSVYFQDGFGAFDQAGFALAKEARSDELTIVLTVLTGLGGTKAIVALSGLLVLWLYWRGYRREAVIVAIVMLGAACMNEGMKNSFARERPVGHNLIARPDSYSFPSAHAMVSSVYYAILASLLPLMIPRSWAKWAAPLLYLLIVAIIASRVYLGVHFPSDVTTGACFAAGWYFLFRFARAKWGEAGKASYYPTFASSQK
ncbi:MULTISPECIES: phosphatase PAP2 family protein [Brevibacillus]|jgi:undecaprenyl-diphosphatase|uniref:phosphatase PAP2 family protein n=1 Tax=Brevibacillus TaxID=55080 RepID=UPI00156272D9|nr:phosphatase PAP2 family protein [Brevibacillus borstelensis]MBE5395968.1 phosphatase PAP2 family protein [Brevibacillus borstelensis]MED1744777.1 phosphatase PAP2 family protein [Brevibacillus borstelensis]MED1876050.1 phosphatase PAP2 family protein [Brevibacillus borstelensis]WNF03880.1 phosphatase PAP2 family protein [Brevibacillus borstelensis]